ncbi:sugar transferase [Bacillus sp. ISL-45]|uniref:sugar transferase n=1 Tax=Bacillus sp. ISL-45 TaxID=2819128 RepID=UPI001BECD812|nr:sugar transferase [Bacillus sp. ISL-45]MBT2661601.1 sugar transferase [Bacillus sp. ISL-45]
MNLAPIILFVYNRPDETYKTIKLLEKNVLADQSHLFVFSDGPKTEGQITKVSKVREIIANIEGFKQVTVINSDSNKGLATSVITGVTSVIERYGKVIVLEDDLETSIYFLKFMNQALDYFQHHQDIWSISGYTPNIELPKDYYSNIYSIPRACSWGWGTWKDRWDKNDWELENYEQLLNNKDKRKQFNKPGNDMSYMLIDQKKKLIDSWAIRWCYSQFINNAYTIYPKYSFIKNTGFSGESTHGSLSKKYDVQICQTYSIEFDKVIPQDKVIMKFAEFYNMTIINYIGRILKTLGLYKKVKVIIKKVRK